MPLEEQLSLGGTGNTVLALPPAQEALLIETWNRRDDSTTAGLDLLASLPTHNLGGMKILHIPTSLSPMSTLARGKKGMKILCIPTTLPKTEATPTKEPAADLRILQIPTSLKEGSNTPALRARWP
ncbi:hypothetical protein AMTR_s00075p00192720 [Amborella trichopoda]|uniref:Uncharacterized protein n=1 Tax=Amborella trichopoda TaxID=13333 RepID=W1PAK1_AMBTC|nr:hypothetical protein AMTR_s00075p00192720 [Amborella trichopoda]